MIYEKINLKDHFPMLKNDVYLMAYCSDNFNEFSTNRVRKSILLLPGGGYCFVSEREGEPIALRMLGHDINVFMLKYTIAPFVYPYPLIETYAALAYIRRNALKYHVNKDQIGVLGFSAGGHLAASCACYHMDEEYANLLNISVEEMKVNGCLLAYPVISTKDFSHPGSVQNITNNYKEELMKKFCIEENITSNFPKTFIWHTADDTCVPIKNSLVLAEALAKNKILFEMHIYPIGDHGLSLANRACNADYVDEEFLNKVAYNKDWIDKAIHFVEEYMGD